MVLSDSSHDKLPEQLYWFDAHLDLAYLAQSGRDMQQDPAHIGEHAVVTFPSLAQGKVLRTLATIFTQSCVVDGPPEDCVDGAWCYSNTTEAYQVSMQQLELYHQWQRVGQITLSCVPSSARNSPNTTPLEAILLLEGAAGIRTPEDLYEFSRRGVVVLALSWVDGTMWSGGDHTGTDITSEGQMLVRQADTLGLIHDVSHLSEKAFWTMLDIAARPKIASHSNCRALLPGKEYPERHLSDQQIKSLAKTGGLIGINLFSKFLVTKGQAEIADVVRHISHIVELTGRCDLIGLGSDMDGGFNATMLPRHMDHPRHLNRLAEALSAHGFSDYEIHGLAHRNWEAFFGLEPLCDIGIT